MLLPLETRLENAIAELSALRSEVRSLQEIGSLRAHRPEMIRRFVSGHYNMEDGELTSQRRPGRIAWPRQIAMYLTRQTTTLTLDDIGAIYGGRDHGTVKHALERVSDEMSINPVFAQEVNEMESFILGGEKRPEKRQLLKPTARKEFLR